MPLPICFNTRPSADVFLVCLSKEKDKQANSSEKAIWSVCGSPWMPQTEICTHWKYTIYAGNNYRWVLCVKSLGIWCFRARAKLGREHSKEGSGQWSWQAHSYWTPALQLQKSHKMHTIRAKWQDILAVTAKVPQQCTQQKSKHIHLPMSVLQPSFAFFYWIWSVSDIIWAAH